MSQISEVWHIYLVYGLLLSLGLAGIYSPLLSTIARWFITKRGLATGIVSAGIGVGVIIMPPFANYLITGYSWRISFMVVGLIALVIPVIAQFLRREPGYSRKNIEEISKTPDKQPHVSMYGLTLQQAVRTRQFWLICAIFFTINISVQSGLVHTVAYATDVGISSTIAATILSVIGVVSTLGKVGLGSAVDRLHSKTVYIVIMILMLIAFLVIQLPEY